MLRRDPRALLPERRGDGDCMRTEYRIDRKRIRLWLTEHDMDQSGLAERVGCAPNTISHALLYGYNCRMDLVLNISDVTGLPVREIVEERPVPGRAR